MHLTESTRTLIERLFRVQSGRLEWFPTPLVETRSLFLFFLNFATRASVCFGGFARAAGCDAATGGSARPAKRLNTQIDNLRWIHDRMDAAVPGERVYTRTCTPSWVDGDRAEIPRPSGDFLVTRFTPEVIG
jgi:hypothetical protein